MASCQGLCRGREVSKEWPRLSRSPQWITGDTHVHATKTDGVIEAPRVETVLWGAEEALTSNPGGLERGRIKIEKTWAAREGGKEHPREEEQQEQVRQVYTGWNMVGRTDWVWPVVQGHTAGNRDLKCSSCFCVHNSEANPALFGTPHALPNIWP